MLLQLFLLIGANGISPECSFEWTKILNSASDPLIPEVYSEMLQYSGFTINNLGNFEGCNSLDTARYAVLDYKLRFKAVQALCGPKVCTKEDYQSISTTLLNPGLPAKYEVVFPTLYQKDHYSELSAGAILMVIFCIVLLGIALMASTVDYFADEKTRKTSWFKWLLCFSLITNGQKLLTTRSQDRLGKRDSLEILNAVRVMSIGWVILGHTCVNYINIAALSNFSSVIDKLSESTYIIVYAGFYAVDTFFWLSGLLMTYLFIIEVEKTPTFSPVKFFLVYVHRFLRITPIFMFLTCFFWTLQEYMSSGPLYYDVGIYFSQCSSYWYTNLIYLNNFIPNWEGSTCLGVGWYLANDMQLFMISPIVILIYMKWRREAGWAIVVTLCALSIVLSWIIARRFNLNPVIAAPINGTNYFNFLYTKPYCRVAPYVLGMATAFILFSHRQYKEKNVTFDKFALCIGKAQDNPYVRWFTFFSGLGLLNILIFSQYDTYKNPGENIEFTYWSNETNWAFIALERSVYGLSLSLIFLPMLLGHFPKLSAILSIYPWSVIARLNFVVYLIHSQIMQIILKSQKNILRFDLYYNIRDTFWFFILSCFFAVPIVLLVEMPASNLEKQLFMRNERISQVKESLVSINKE